MSLPEHFDAVVVGSGFGGSVMACRLAEAGLRVCLLERGKAWPPHSFPRAPYDLARNFWDPSEGLYGMFNIWSFKGSGAVVSSGLGGGSLIYANVLIRKDEAWFKDDLPDGAHRDWPVTRAQLDPHYDRVEAMMNVQHYPLGHVPHQDTPKTRAMRDAARALNPDGAPGIRWQPLPLAVSFRCKPVARPEDDPPDNPARVGAPIQERRPNYHSVVQKRDMPRATCRLCGECDLGCNYGSKNTLDYTYLTAAIHQPVPADIRTLCEVKRIEPRNGARGYTVEYLRHDPERPRGDEAEPEPVALTCDRLILAAGTFGTPFLLMKNRARLLRLSSALGSRYCVNGDLLSFLVRATEERDGKSVPRRLDPSFGPVITSAIRFGDTLDGHGNLGRGFYVEDGGHPYLLSWFIEMSGALGYLRRGFHFLRLLVNYQLGRSADADLGAEIAHLLGEAATSASSMPVLSMGRDVPSARLFLRDGRLDCDWRLKDSAAYYERVRHSVRAIAGAIGARYMDNPSFAWNFQQVLTAHPLGGCPMGRNNDEGVVDDCGQVFGHRDLYIADGSVLPGPVGPNPSLTIAALADRFADRITGRATSGGVR